MSVVVDGEAFLTIAPDRGFTLQAFHLKPPDDGDSLVEIRRDGEPYRRFLFPAYKIWNIVAHFADIVDSEIAGDFRGYDLAGWNGFGIIRPSEVGPDE